MEDCKFIRVPFDPKVKLQRNTDGNDELKGFPYQKVVQRNTDGNDELKGFPYQKVVGSLMYAMLCTRFDLAYPISVLNQHMANLSMEHWMAIKRIF
jgi:hypothetical protein